ncbi:hypothetical protein BT67DRAFT_79748 [Trichocladium antarcticum]|uniref:Uncharacterized protein n=1 Tax=Trichocladium antarcticum TaxID=1450529 RepID=A0AAN6UGU0_9PEZI|nr:hypothetical protein BT67DRAFT_79748 [Trichocladium antarcticum]
MQVWSPGSGLDRLEVSNDLEQPIADALFPPSARGLNNAGYLYGLGFAKQSASLRLLTSVSGTLHSSRSIPDSRVLIGFRAEIECRKTIIAAPIFAVHLPCRCSLTCRSGASFPAPVPPPVHAPAIPPPIPSQVPPAIPTARA